jgi:hypothetical protein
MPRGAIRHTRWRRLRVLLRLANRRLRRSRWPWIVLSLLGIQALAALLIYSLLPDWPVRAQFGDMFGAVNAFFAGLAFAGVVYAVLLQREELRLQRRELQLTRQQIAEQTKIHAQRLDMLLAAQQPRLRFVGVVGKIDEGPTPEYEPATGVLTIELSNDGGPMTQAVGRIWYGLSSGPFTDLFPQDQAEEATITRTSSPDDLVHDIPRESPCFLHLPCRLHSKVRLADVEITFRGYLYIRYFNSLSLPRVSDYRIIIQRERGQVFFMRDVDPVRAARLGFLDEDPREHYDDDEEATIEDLYPELRA